LAVASPIALVELSIDVETIFAKSAMMAAILALKPA
jgi:hypothetical protein